jgi:excisionase family DNA binding protein
MKRMLTIGEAAEQLGLSPKTVWSWIYSRRLGFVRLGRSIRIPQSAIEELIEAGSIPAKIGTGCEAPHD